MYSELTPTDKSFVLKRRDNNSLNFASNEVFCFCCVRDEFERLDYFFNFHRSLGVTRFFIVDNDSSDNSHDFLLSQHDVHLFFTKDSYSASKCGVDWLNLLLSTFGVDHWCLTLDADELFIYPFYESYPLKQLIAYLESNGYQAVETFMLDMYSSQTIRSSVYKTGSPFLDTCNFFDPSGYEYTNNSRLPVRGGVRHRLFWEGFEREKPSPVLRKVPFVKWREDLSYMASTHIIHQLKLAQLTGILLHFKLFSDFFDRAEQETNRKEHWDSAAQYCSYWDVLSKKPDLTAYNEQSVAYTNSSVLIKLGLMISDESYMDQKSGVDKP